MTRRCGRWPGCGGPRPTCAPSSSRSKTTCANRCGWPAGRLPGPLPEGHGVVDVGPSGGSSSGSLVFVEQPSVVGRGPGPPRVPPHPDRAAHALPAAVDRHHAHPCLPAVHLQQHSRPAGEGPSAGTPPPRCARVSESTRCSAWDCCVQRSGPVRRHGPWEPGASGPPRRTALPLPPQLPALREADSGSSILSLLCELWPEMED